jgi:hypothetical protein
MMMVIEYARKTVCGDLYDNDNDAPNYSIHCTDSLNKMTKD